MRAGVWHYSFDASEQFMGNNVEHVERLRPCVRSGSLKKVLALMPCFFNMALLRV